MTTLGPPCCGECGGPDPIRDDGPVMRCWQCIAAIGRIVADPRSAHPAVLGRLERRHLDVVHLASRPDRDGIPTFAWRWTASWATDHTLLRRAPA